MGAGERLQAAHRSYRPPTTPLGQRAPLCLERKAQLKLPVAHQSRQEKVATEEEPPVKCPEGWNLLSPLGV